MKKKKNIWYGMRVYSINEFHKVNVIEETDTSILAEFKDGSTQYFLKKSEEHIYTKSKKETAQYIHGILCKITEIKKKIYELNKQQQETFEQLHEKYLPLDVVEDHIKRTPRKKKKKVKAKKRRIF